MSYGGKQAYFNGQYFTRGRNGPRLNEQESEEAWTALRRGLQRSLNNLLRIKMRLARTRAQFG